MATVGFLQTLGDGLLEWSKLRVVAAMKAFDFDKLPQSFNEVEIWENTWATRVTLCRGVALVPSV